MTTKPKPPAKPLTKLHFANTLGGPKCDRHLTQGRSYGTTDSSGMLLTAKPGEVGCRHCLRAMGLLPPVVYRARSSEEGDDGKLSELLERELGEEAES
jgi:hypothetical protein